MSKRKKRAYMRRSIPTNMTPMPATLGGAVVGDVLDGARDRIDTACQRLDTLTDRIGNFLNRFGAPPLSTPASSSNSSTATEAGSLLSTIENLECRVQYLAATLDRAVK